MEKILRLYKLVDGGINDTPFPNSDNPIEIGAFRYDAKRMGGAPTITASVNYPSCLDDVWTEDVYAEFNGEKYYLKQTPTSSYNNESTMYKHDLELVSERIILDNVYFFDMVVGDPQGEDKPVSNSTNVVFFGNIHEFVSRINSSLQYAKLQKVSTDGAVTGYKVVVDEEIETEEKLMSFEDKFFSNVLQEIYNTYEVPYYFEGKTIHIGWAKSDVVIPTLGYGVDDALLSITKNNTNNKIINRATGTGSSDNIPFYYPNNSPKGEIAATSSNEGLSVTIVDTELYSNAVELKGVITRSNIDYENLSVKHLNESIYSGETFSGNMGYGGIGKRFTVSFDTQDVGELLISFSSNVVKYTLDGVDITDADFSVRYSLSLYSAQKKKTVFTSGMLDAVEGVRVPITSAGTGYILNIQVNYAATGKYAGKGGNITYNASFDFGSESGWTYDGKAIELKDVGLKVEGNPVVGDTITQTLVKYIKTSQKLLPSVYRETDGAERFYNATNNTYEGVTFNNPYVEGHPKEHIITVEDIKPSIKEMVNSMGLRMDMFSEFAYDLDDNDELIENEEGSEREYVHSYFFGKLRKLDFNLFDHAIEQQPMTISFTSGDCGACNFEIGVTEEFPQKNPVQVNADGTLKRDEKGRVICGQFEDIAEDECQPQQQDTINNEVWIALKKEDSTYGILMPRDVHRPKACAEGKNDGDTFVILGINLPLSYILNAEKMLEEEIIRYMKENNDEKFTFSIGFSRIYFEDNSAVLNQLSENSKISITYDDKPYDLYVSSFSYNMSEGDVLPEIRVELDDTLKVSQNALQNAISQVKSDLGRALSNIDVVGAATPYFIRKDADDEAQGRINFAKGIKFGEGGKVDIFDNNSAKLTIEYLEVTKKASFTSLEIQEKTHVGGQMLITPAAINCGEVEEFEDFYRCYFQTKGAEGDEIFNQFAIGDQAICQTYNAWGSKYYWRLVVGIGEDYIDLSKTECDEESGIPSAGDKIIQLGNQGDVERQNAIVIAAYGDGSPYIIQYKGIDSFELSKDKMVTKLASDENIFTGTVHMEMGSSISNNIIENLDERIKDAIGGIAVGKYNLLRNSGFTGDYMSLELDSNEPLESNAEMYSDPFAYWSSKNASVQDSVEAASGKEVNLQNGSLSQELLDKIILGESYVLSFKAKGSSLKYTIGGASDTIILNDSWTEYVYKFTASEANSVFIISNAQAVICDLQLERGNIQSSWGYSMWDNPKELARLQSMQYLESAIRQGSTDILGGLIMSNIMMLGNPDKADNTAGISGIYNDNANVAYWSGGSFSQAISAVMKYLDNPTYQPTEEELASMANFVVTHGGRAILNDAIVRGNIYATDGKFAGEIEALKGRFGDLHLVSYPLYGDSALEGTKTYDSDEEHRIRIQSDYFEMQGLYEGQLLEYIKISPYHHADRFDMSGVVDIEAQKDMAAINIGQGHIAGLRHNISSTSQSAVTLGENSPYVTILTSSATVYLSPTVECGTTFHIVNANRAQRLTLGMQDSSQSIILNAETGTTASVHEWDEGTSNPYKIEAYFDGNLWYICPIK